MTLTNPGGGGIDDSEGTATITDNDAAPQLCIANATVAEGADFETTEVTLDVTLDEIDENFFLYLSNAVNASIVDAQGLGTITDDDPLPSVAIGDVTVTEGDTGTVTASFHVTLAPASGRQVSVSYATADGTATAPADYSATSGELTFAAGETTKQVTVPVHNVWPAVSPTRYGKLLGQRASG